MESWFGQGTSGFKMFGTEHVFILCLIFIVSVTIYVLRFRIMGMHAFKTVLLMGLILSEVSYHFWAIYNDMWTAKYFLPLQLCSINSLLSIVLLLTDNRKLFGFVYLFGLTGAIQGLLTPELYQEPWHFRFIQYFIAHAFIVWTALYYAMIKSFRISWALFFMSFLWLNVYALGVYMINFVIGANYMFLMKKPENASLMDYLGPYPWYILALELVALCLCLFAFIPVKEKSHGTRNDHPPFSA